MAIIKGEFIKTVRGGGHMLAADVTEEAIERQETRNKKTARRFAGGFNFRASRRGPQIRKIARKDRYPVEGAEEKPRKSPLPQIVAFISHLKTGSGSLFRRISRPETGRSHAVNFHVIY